MPSWAIVGAARGIGFGYVQQLSKSRENEIFAIIRSQSTAGPLNELAKAAPNVHIVQTDTSDPKKLEDAVAQVGKESGHKLDVLIYNAFLGGTEAAALPPSQFLGKEQALEQEILQTMQHNVLNVMYTINAFLPLIRNADVKKVIFISTGFAALDVILKSGVPFQMGYCVSKAAANMVMAKYAVELASEGVLTLSISPGWVATDTATEFTKDPSAFEFILKSFQKVDPDVKGMITVQESVEAQLNVIEHLGPAQSGRFVSHHGNEDWF